MSSKLYIVKNNPIKQECILVSRMAREYLAIAVAFSLADREYSTDAAMTTNLHQSIISPFQLLSCCLVQKGKDEEGLFGFLYPDILVEVERSKKHVSILNLLICLSKHNLQF